MCGKGLSSTVSTISNLWGQNTLDKASVHSKRTAPRLLSDIFVVGDSPMERNIREFLNARRVSDRSHSPNRFSGARAVIAAAHHCDFESLIGTKQAARREALIARAEQIVLDSVIAKVGHLVLVSTAMVSGTWPNRSLISDDEGTADQEDGYIGDVVAFEFAFNEAVEALTPEMRPHLTILRAAATAGPDIDTLVTRHFEAPRVLALKGVEKTWQFAHVHDIAQAALVAIEKQLYGTLVVGAVKEVGETFIPDALSLGEVLSATNMRSIEVTKETAFGTAHRLHKVGLLPSPARDLEMTVYSWTVFPQRLLESGWRPKVSSLECIEQISVQARGRIGVAGRRVGHKDAAALGAAGAAVALLSTAAIWRQARGSR